MNNDLKKILNSDTDGLLTYEYIANHMGSCDEDMPVLADNIIRVDMTGQITVSAALYLHATGAEKYREIIDKLIAASLSKDREHKYIVDLLSGIWGAGCALLPRPSTLASCTARALTALPRTSA